MPSLSDKLKSLGVQIGAQGLNPEQDQPSRIPLDEILPGSWHQTRRGDTFVVQKSYPLDESHGNLSLQPADDLSWLESYPSLEGISSLALDTFAFIDTETTGLSGGTGTYTFLIGAGRYSKDSLDLAQFFMQDPAMESAQLAALEEFLSPVEVLISYNGKSFDLPRLRTRYRANGWPSPVDDCYHIDLLHIARRVWRSLLPTCSLGDIEYYLLDVERTADDIPGWMVADTFFEYMRSGDPSPLRSVFYHNEMDVLSLSALLRYFSVRFSTPISPDYQQESDLVAIGCYLSSLKLFDPAAEVLKHALEMNDLNRETVIAALMELAGIYKKQGRYQQALPLWKKAAISGDIEAHIELAKAYEHQIKSYQEAIHWTLSAADLLGSRSSDSSQKFTSGELGHRLTRLKKKAARKKGDRETR